ncbi:MAG: ABC transporter ATP-binding protein [Acidobacteriia bacterium]|nr:ABC transporter ATP-binding protein [Terriglobia bacterium]
MPAETTATATTTREGVDAHSGVLIEARDLRKSYGAGGSEITVLSGVNASIEVGELVAVVGPSGAGKSTLLHLLAALDMPTSGAVYFEKKAIDSFEGSELADYRNRSIGFVWQRHHLLADFTAAENVAMPLLMRGAGYTEALETSARWLREVGLEARTKHRAGELSGGEQQRVAIARALVQEPALLLADEPTGDLDERNAIAVFELMQRLHRTHRLTSILATHNTVLAGRADRVLQLEHGLLLPVGDRTKPGSMH